MTESCLDIGLFDTTEIMLRYEFFWQRSNSYPGVDAERMAVVC